MQQSHIDSIFRSGLINHKTALDKDALWAAINQEPNKPKGVLGWARVKKWGLLSIAALGILVSGLLWLYPPAETLQHTAATKVPLEVEHKATNTTIINIIKNNIEAQTLPNTKVENDKLQHSALHNARQEAIPKAITETKKSRHKNTTQKNNNSIVTPVSNKQIDQAQIKTRNTTKTAIGPIENQDQISSTGTKNTIQAQKSRAPALEKEEEFDKKVKTKVVSKILKPTSQFKMLSMLDSHLTPLVYKRPVPNNNNNNNKKIECYEYGKKKRGMRLEFYGSIDGIQKNLTAISENQEYITNRKNSQKQQEGYRAGVRAKFYLFQNFNIKLGIEAGLTKERFQRETTETITEIKPDQLLEKIIKNDTTIYIYGDAPVTSLITTAWDVGNSYRSLDIPMTIGYEFIFKKLTYGIDIGASYNILYDFKGYLIDTNDMPVSTPDYFKSKINTSMLGGLSINYQMKDNYYLFAFTSIKHNLKNINNTINEAEQKNTRLGIGIGIGYNFK